MSITITDFTINSINPNDVTVYTGLQPVFSWDFVENPVNFAQAGFEIRISNVNTGLGSGGFHGSELSVVVTSSVPIYEYFNYNLQRGTTYYGQVRCWDYEYDFNSPDPDHISGWTTFSFKVNSLPVISSVSLFPSSPTSVDDLYFQYSYSDADDHEDYGTKIRWYKHGILQEEFNDVSVIKSKYTITGDSWTVKIIPFDGLEYGVPVESSAVEVEHTPIEFTTLEILPEDPNTNDILKVNYEIDDSNPYIDINSLTVKFNWYINNTLSLSNSESDVARLHLHPGDIVKALAVVYDIESGVVVTQVYSDEITILEPSWKVFDIKVNGYTSPSNITDLNPIVTWKVFKSNDNANEIPKYLRVIVSRTQSRQSVIYDSGTIIYTTNSHKISLSRGQKYYVHVGVGDDVDNLAYDYKEVITSGSAWTESVNNTIGWTIEFQLKLTDTGSGNFHSVSIHDGTKYCLLSCYLDKIRFYSSEFEEYKITSVSEHFDKFQTVRITGKQNSCKIYLNNRLVLNLSEKLTSNSQAKRLEFGDLNSSTTTSGSWKFLRFSTLGDFNIGDTSSEENDFDFFELVKIENGSIEDFESGIISWTPDDPKKSAILFEFNENGKVVTLPTVNKNFSPITSIYIDKDNNKYLATGDGIRAVYGSKHEPDYQLGTTVTSNDFDRITNVSEDLIDEVEYFSNGYLVIDTTASNIGTSEETNILNSDGSEYDPYFNTLNSHAVHYLSQRAPGHKWFDLVDNSKGWQVELNFLLGALQQEDFEESSLSKDGVGIYVNDGTYHEVIIFTANSIRLLYANVYATINMSLLRHIRITAKENTIKIYQRLSSVSSGNEQLILDGSGLFTEPSTKTADSKKPKLAVDSDGFYHAVWHDNSGGKSSIFYSKQIGDEWTNPEVVIESSPFTVKNPDLFINTDNRIFVVYEDLSYYKPEISVSIRDDYGWNPKIRLTNFNSFKSGPKITGDSSGNVYVVWEDHRNGRPEIFAATRNKHLSAWISSAQFGTDTNIVSYTENDPTIAGKAIGFKNPAITFLNSYVYVAFEVDFGNNSAIYISYYDVQSKNWNSSGYPQFTSEGIATAKGTSISVSSLTRNCFRPDIVGVDNHVVAVWEDHSEEKWQIWGSSLLTENTTELVPPTKITDRINSCRNPVVSIVLPTRNVEIFFETSDNVGDSGEEGVIGSDNAEMVEYNDFGQIYHSSYNLTSKTFFGSGTGYDDNVVLIGGEKLGFNPCVAKKYASTTFPVLFDFIKTSAINDLESQERTPFSLIGGAIVTDNGGPTTTSLNTESVFTVSQLNTKEFAIGDFSDDLSARIYVKDLKMYFGYNDKPLSILTVNKSTTENWPDDRVYDVFADASGGILAATYSGLAYYSTLTSKVKMVPLGGSAQPLVTSINFSKNGIWFVGTSENLYYSTNGGQNWSAVSEISGYIYDIAIDTNGGAVIATNNGVYTVNVELGIPQNSVTTQSRLAGISFKTVAVDERNIIWAGYEDGLYRIDETNNTIKFDISNGMSSSHVNDIVVVDKATRYIATATGIDKMYGFSFEPINTTTHPINNNNILSLNYNQVTKSLWFSSLNKLNEIVFRDPETNRISDEVTEYAEELNLSESYDAKNYYILDTDKLVESGNVLEVNNETTKVFVNKNQVDFGYTVNPQSKSVFFDTNMLSSDFVEVQVSNKLSVYKNFAQNNIEKEVLGELKTEIPRLVTTSKGQLIALAVSDVNSILANIGTSSVPFTILTIDRDKPVACLQLVDQLSRSEFKFKVLTSDETSGVNEMMISNYENFTSDGETPLEFTQYQTYVTQDIGESLNNTTVSMTIPETTTINNQTYAVGDGKFLLTTVINGTTYIYAFTSNPVVVFRMNVAAETWEPVTVIDSGNSNITLNAAEVIDNNIYLMTGNTAVTNDGKIYRSTDGTTFINIGSVGNNATACVPYNNVVYISNDAGAIYRYSDGLLTQRYSGVGAIITSMAVSENKLLASTGNSGRLYIIDLSTNNISILYQGKETKLGDIIIIGDTAYVSGGLSSTVYNSDTVEWNFVKAYQTVTGSTVKLYTVLDDSVKDIFESAAV